MKQGEINSASGSSSRANLIVAKNLTTRELRALELLSKFLTNKEIADRLGISLPAAKKLLHSAYPQAWSPF